MTLDFKLKELDIQIQKIDPVELLLDIENNYPEKRKEYLKLVWDKGILLKDSHSHTNNTDIYISNLGKSIECFHQILEIDQENTEAIAKITNIYSILAHYHNNKMEIDKSIMYLTQSLFISPTDPSIHYNLGHLLGVSNDFQGSITHYKLSLSLNNRSDQNLKNLAINSFNGIANVYRGLQNWPTSLYYLNKALSESPTDPDINNQLGTVYTEMRRTDLAEKSYLTAVDNYKDSVVTQNKKSLLADIYLNYGHLKSYNGDNFSSINLYNKSMNESKGYILPFQNKLMNLHYISDQIENSFKYISDQHLLINNILPKSRICDTILSKKATTTDLVVLGFVSGDFIDHPVSFFISNFLKKFNNLNFKVVCYSQTIITKTTTSTFPKVKFNLIKGLSKENVCKLITDDCIDILIDLSGHTAHNRLDVFALKPCRIQVNYIGYPFSTGLNEMDYRITDEICENNCVKDNQKWYTEKLVTLPECFLCFDHLLKPFPEIRPDKTTNKNLVLGCFNRLNKITKECIEMYKTILKESPNVIIVFKTKALLNDSVKNNFISKFENPLQQRIKIYTCTTSHTQHLYKYNQIDYALDTFPYSGTTTSCEALGMGVPVFTIKKDNCHAQNVTASILENTNTFKRFICDSKEDLVSKIKDLAHSRYKNPVTALSIKNFKMYTRNEFFKGSVCDGNKHTLYLEKLFQKIYKQHQH